MRLPIYQYHAAASPRELCIHGAGAVLNDNTDFSIYRVRTAGELMWPGFEARGNGVNDKPKVRPKFYQTSVYRLDRPGLTLFSRKSPKDITVVKVSDEDRESALVQFRSGTKKSVSSSNSAPFVRAPISPILPQAIKRIWGLLPRNRPLCQRITKKLNSIFKRPPKHLREPSMKRMGSTLSCAFGSKPPFPGSPRRSTSRV